MEQEKDGGPRRLKMPFFHTPVKPGMFPLIYDAADNQSPDLRLNHRTEMLRDQKRPAAAVENVNRVCFTGDWLNTVKRAGDSVAFSVVAVVDVAVTVIVRGAEPENQAIAALELPGQLFILHQILQTVMGVLNEKTAVLPDRPGTEPAVAGTD